VYEKEAIEGQTNENGERVERRQDCSNIVALCINRHPVHQVGKHNAPEKAGENAADANHPFPEAVPSLTLALTAELEGRATQDERKEYQKHLWIECAEHRGIPARKGREHCATCRDQPDLIGIPEGSNRVYNHAPLTIVFTQER
jgi:hypothetical protein